MKTLNLVHFAISLDNIQYRVYNKWSLPFVYYWTLIDLLKRSEDVVSARAVDFAREKKDRLAVGPGPRNGLKMRRKEGNRQLKCYCPSVEVELVGSFMLMCM